MDYFNSAFTGADCNWYEAPHLPNLKSLMLRQASGKCLGLHFTKRSDCVPGLPRGHRPGSYYFHVRDAY